MTRQSFVMRNFRILYGPLLGSPADAQGIGVADPAALRAESHLTIPFAAPDAYAVPIGLGMLYSKSHPPEDHVVRVDIQLGDRWTEFDPDYHQEPRRAQTETLVGRPRRPRRAPVASVCDAPPYPDHPPADQR